MVGGQLFDAETMAEIGGAKRVPAGFYFNEGGRLASGGKAPAHAQCGGHGTH